MKAILMSVVFSSLFSIMYAFFIEENVREMDSRFVCPDEELIRPCVCIEDSPLSTVTCEGVKNLKTVHRALRNRFHVNAIPYLKIRNCQLMGLPSSAFKNISVTRLQISDSNLSFVAADAFEGLETLMVLTLHKVRLFNFPSSQLSPLSSLLTLSLPENKITSLTRNDLRHIGNVRYFAVSHNRIALIERGSFPPGLVTLYLSNNHLLSLNNSVRHLPYLEWLTLSENRLISVEGEFDGLFNLRYLNLANNLLRTFGNSFHDLRNLKILELQYNNIYNLGDSFQNLQNLRRLNLSQNILLQIHNYSFKDLVSLENLDLSGNHLMTLDGAIGSLYKLKVLDLSKNILNNFTIHEIRYLRNLTQLDVSRNSLNNLESDLTAVSSTMKLKMIFLSHNRLQDFNDFLKHFTRLETVDISNNNFSRFWSRDFESLRHLEYINVTGNPLDCDEYQLRVIHILENQNVEVEGAPTCPNLQLSSL